jgi:hypothetical protein
MDDLRDMRGRFRRLVLAAVLGFALTWLAMTAINNSGPRADDNPIGAGSVPLLAICMFIVTTAAISAVLARLARRVSAR